MKLNSSEPLIRFRQLFSDAPAPGRADAGLSGTATLRAFRFCEPFTAASSFGWYVFPPMDFSPLYQIQPLPRVALEETLLDSFSVDKGLDKMDAPSWEALESALRLREKDGDQIGAYKREARRRARSRKPDRN